MKKSIVLKVGGSLLFNSDLTVRKEQILKFASILQKAPNIAAVIVGGGKIARTYINAARLLNANESICDILGIGASRLNARLLIASLGDAAFPEPITSVQEARIAHLWNKILISGGFIPGQSTTSVAFEIAEAIQATDVVILTDVDGIYDKDPHQFPEATKFDTITVSELENVIYGAGGSSQSAAGEYRIFDAVSLQILKRNQLNVRLANGENHTELQKLLVDQDFSSKIGTKIIK